MTITKNRRAARRGRRAALPPSRRRVRASLKPSRRGSRANLPPSRPRSRAGHSAGGRRAFATVAALTLLALPLAACGSDDGGGAAGASQSATTAAGTATNAAGMRDRAELQACLRAEGIELPQPPAGAGRPPQGDAAPPSDAPSQNDAAPPNDAAPQSDDAPPSDDAPQNDAAPPSDAAPQGDAAAQNRASPPSGGFLGRALSAAERRRMQAAFERCGARFGPGPGGPGRPGAAGARGGGRPDAAALARFVACVRRNGYDLPDPNTSGDGPVFDDDQVDRDDPAFVSASRACQRYLAPTS